LRVFYCSEAAERFQAEKGAAFTIALSREESRHAAKVLRLAVGDEVRLFDGAGFFYEGRIASLACNEVEVRIESRAASTSDPRARLVLLVALLKGRKADFLIQKAVELGVGEIVFFQARRSVSHTRAPDKEEERSGQEEEGSGRERWEKIAISACKQCGRATLMPVRELPDLNAALRALPHTPIRYVFWEALRQTADTHTAVTQAAGTQASAATQEPLAIQGPAAVQQPPATQEPAATQEPPAIQGPAATQRPAATQEPAALFPGARAASAEMVAMIGPEGGFTQEEINRILAAGFRACSLGPRILRAETAALAAATILLRQAGELGSEKQLTTETQRHREP
jgi:16S rRNA (uracil1498-N3)-methyltransferase